LWSSSKIAEEDLDGSVMSDGPPVWYSALDSARQSDICNLLTEVIDCKCYPKQVDRLASLWSSGGPSGKLSISLFAWMAGLLAHHKVVSKRRPALDVAFLCRTFGISPDQVSELEEYLQVASPVARAVEAATDGGYWLDVYVCRLDLFVQLTPLGSPQRSDEHL
jgi:hypothetical protein